MIPYGAGMRWGEGPRWFEGALWLSDTQGSRLWTDNEGTWQPHELASPSNGLWFLPDGRLVGAMMREARIGQWDGMAFADYADLAGLARGALGDLVGDAAGNLYVDDVGQDGDSSLPGQLIVVDPGGDARVAADDLDFPNGLAFIEDGRTLVVAETNSRRLTAFDVQPDGTLTHRRRYANLAASLGGAARPDGIWGSGDDIWVATLEGHALVRFSGNSVVETIDTGALLPVACCTDEAGRLFATLADTHGHSVPEAISTQVVDTIVAIVTGGSCR